MERKTSKNLAFQIETLYISKRSKKFLPMTALLYAPSQKAADEVAAQMRKEVLAAARKAKGSSSLKKEALDAAKAAYKPVRVTG